MDNFVGQICVTSKDIYSITFLLHKIKVFYNNETNIFSFSLRRKKGQVFRTITNEYFLNNYYNFDNVKKDFDELRIKVKRDNLLDSILE